MRHNLCSAFPIVLLGLFASPVEGADSDATLSWERVDNKDVLTGEVKIEFASRATFSDGNSVQAIAKCAANNYPGVQIQAGTFQGSNYAPMPYAWQNKKISLPLLVNGKRRADVRAYTENPRANQIPIGFYDPAAAKRLTRQDVPPLLRGIEAGQAIIEMKNAVAWDNFVAGTAGTIADLLQATSIRVQFPLADGSANVAEINPQDAVLKDFVQRCNSHFQTKIKTEQEATAVRQAELEKEQQRKVAAVQEQAAKKQRQFAADDHGNYIWRRDAGDDRSGEKLCRAGRAMHVYLRANHDSVRALPPNATFYLNPAKQMPGGTNLQIVGPGLPQNGGLPPYCRVRVSGSGEVVMINVEDLVPD